MAADSQETSPDRMALNQGLFERRPTKSVPERREGRTEPVENGAMTGWIAAVDWPVNVGMDSPDGGSQRVSGAPEGRKSQHGLAVKPTSSANPGKHRGHSVFLPAFLAFFSAFFSFMDLAGFFFSSFFVSMFLPMTSPPLSLSRGGLAPIFWRIPNSRTGVKFILLSNRLQEGTNSRRFQK